MHFRYAIKNLMQIILCLKMVDLIPDFINCYFKISIQLKFKNEYKNKKKTAFLLRDEIKFRRIHIVFLRKEATHQGDIRCLLQDYLLLLGILCKYLF